MSWEAQRSHLYCKIQDPNLKEAVFEEIALEIFHFQYTFNPVYQEFVNLINVDPGQIENYSSIPALPIQLFKSRAVTSFEGKSSLKFESSRTTGQKPSIHQVYDQEMYRFACRSIFEEIIGQVESFCFLALLPSYLERKNSSLVYMVDYFMHISPYRQSGFYLDDFEKLHNQLFENQQEGIPTILFGVSFALLDFFSQYPMDYSNLIIIETGGMKGRKVEMVKSEIVQLLKEGSSAQRIISEYGMTELLSQFYAVDGLHFNQHKLAKALTVQINDPFQIEKPGKAGFLKIIDLANLDSCSFILTEDIAVLHPNSQFEILGRGDASDIRGCNLLYTG